MIYIDISVEPHYHKVIWDVDKLKPTPESPPPHVVIKRDFPTTDEAKQYVDRLGLSEHNLSEAHQTLEGTDDEYVQVEIELLEVTGKEYTKAVLSIEGQAE